MLWIHLVVTAFQGILDVPDHGVDSRKQLISHRFMATSCHYCSMWVSSVSYSRECTESVTDNTAGMITEMAFRPEFQLLFPETGDHANNAYTASGFRHWFALQQQRGVWLQNLFPVCLHVFHRPSKHHPTVHASAGDSCPPVLSLLA